jgi:xanthine dehydrogenase accessory factor
LIDELANYRRSGSRLYGPEWCLLKSPHRPSLAIKPSFCPTARLKASLVVPVPNQPSEPKRWPCLIPVKHCCFALPHNAKKPLLRVVLVRRLPCLSGGTLEIFLEPVRPAPVLVIIGDTPIARSLAKLGKSTGYELGDDPNNATAVVVASHGRDEEDILRSALNADAEYIGLVASTKRGAAVLGSLGMCTSHTSRVHTPAGLDIGATTPDEIALSILAEIVSCRPRPTGRPIVESQLGADSSVSDHAPTAGADGAIGVSDLSTTADAGAKLSVPVAMVATGSARVTMAIDPVCSMTVAMVESSLHFDSEGQRFWFCGSGCLRAFAAAPGDYASVSA